MYPSRRVNDSVHWYMGELTSRVVAESGIPSDRHHLGKILLQSLKDDPDFILQIDGATGESETNGSVLERSVRCAIALKNLGLQRGDVMTLMAPNHIDLAVPFYAGLYLGVIVAAIDRTLGVKQLQRTFEVSRPKIIFCQDDRALDVKAALSAIGSDAVIVAFDKGQHTCTFSDFLKTYGDNSPVEEFKATDFNPEDTIALLIATSGTTGMPKGAAATHKCMTITLPYAWSRYAQHPYPTKMAWIVSPLQWLTGLICYLMSPVLRFTRLQSSQTLTQSHAYELINKYKPTYTIISPTFATRLISPEGDEQCDLSCFDTFLVGGSAVTPDLIQKIKNVAPNADVLNGYGISELTQVVLFDDGTVPGSGKQLGAWQYRLIHVETQEDIYEPKRSGELWIKGPGMVQGYYRNPEATAEAFTEDGWFKTGDMFYRDENYNFFFVERIKLLLKFYVNNISHHIFPLELEKIIRQHPGVLDVAVTGIPEPKQGELPVACVVRCPGSNVSADEIKQVVKDNLPDYKHLRGGVIFLDAIPQTASTKVHRRKLKEIAMQTPTE